MKRDLVLAALLSASQAVAQGAPMVDESSGAVGYVYSFALPGARGQYQPSLALVYSSHANGNVGYGVGWQLSESYIEQNPVARLVGSNNVTRYEYRLSHGGGTTLLLPVGAAPFQTASTIHEYRPEVASAYYSVRSVSYKQWVGKDDRGSTYVFDCLTTLCSRWYLTKVTDPSGNVSVLEYDLNQPPTGSTRPTARLKAIRYNAYDPSAPTSTSAPVNPAYFATHVELTYEESTTGSPVPLALRHAAGAVVDYRHRLTSVAIRNEAPGGRTTVLSYLLGYLDGTSKSELLGSIAERGGATPTTPERKTSFLYGVAGLSASQFSLAAPTIISRPGEFQRPGWMDVDGDGRPDLVQDGRWVRNVTPIGADTLALEITNIRTMVNYAPGAFSRDVDGDGINDLVNAGTCATSPRLAVRFGSVDADHNIEYGPTICFNTQAADAFHRLTYGTALALKADSLKATLTDITGDGVADVVIASSSAWNVFAGYRDLVTGDWGFAESPSTYVGLAGDPGDVESLGQTRLIDLNGDALPDHVSVTSGSWNVRLGSSNMWGGNYGWNWLWYSGSTLTGPALGLHQTVSRAAAVGCGPDGNLAGAPETLEGTNPIALRDLNNDGLADHVFFEGSSTARIAWNTGRGFVAGPTFSMIFYPEARYVPEHSDMCADFSYAIHSAWGADGTMIDLNGDGVVDYATLLGASGLANKFQKGSNGVQPGAPFALSSVTVPDGAVYSLTYGGALGYHRGIPVATSVSVSGLAMEPNTVHYAYGEMRPGVVWYGGGQPEERGFRESWSWDDVTRIVRHTIRETDTHAFAQSAVKLELGSLIAAGSPPTYSVFSWTDTVVGARAVASAGCAAAASSDPSWSEPGCGSRREPLATSYPILTFASEVRAFQSVAGRTFGTKTWVPLSDASAVDSYGNVLKTYGDPDTDPVATADDVLVEHSWYDANPVCKSCPQAVTWKSPADQAVLQSRRYSYTPTGLPTSESFTAGGVSRTYHGNGNLATLQEGNVTTTFTYDEPHQLRLTKTQVAGSGKTLVTDHSFDPVTGRLTLVVGPYLSGSSEPKLTRAMAYDPLGRIVATARSPIQGNAISNALEAVVYDDTSPVRSVKTYVFGAARSFTLGGSVPDGDDVGVKIVYRDGLGRSVQTRERLGSGSAANPNTNVIRSLSGYRVTSTINDGAGRTRVGLDPFYSSSDAFQDHRIIRAELIMAANSPSGLRGTAVAYDAEGRISCSSYQFVRGALPESPGGCYTSETPDTYFALATSYTYSAQQKSGSRWFVAARITGPGSQTTTLSDASRRIHWTLDPSGNGIFVLRDRMGRERASGRESSSGVRLESTTLYDSAGRVEMTTDPSRGTRVWTYDTLGLVSKVTVGSSQSIEYKYDDLNRLTKMEQVRDDSYTHWDPNEGANVYVSVRTVLKTSSFGYDVAYGSDAASYGNVAGRKAWESNAETTIAYGYDQVGRANRRDQWIRGITGRLGNGATYRDDGGTMTAKFGLFGSGGADPAPLDYAAWYDSAGRVVKVGTATTAFLEVPGTGYGGFDPLGRASIVTADDGRATTNLTYSPYTGRLTADEKTLGSRFYWLADMTYVASRLQAAEDKVNQVRYANTYDSSGRLDTSTAVAISSPCASLAQQYGHKYSFSLNKTWNVGASVGNLELVEETKPNCPAGTSSTTSAQYNYGGTDQVKSLTPFLGSSPTLTPLGANVSYGYDLEDRLETITRPAGQSETLAYGASGELLRRQVGTTVMFYAGSAGTITGTLPAGCSAPSATCNVTVPSLNVDAHVLLGGIRIASVSPARTLFYYRDQKGSVVATSIKGGAVGAQYRYTPYGSIDKVTGETPANASDLGYTAGVKLTGGLLYLRARIYDPQLKKFLSADAVDIYRYTYAGGDPINFSDPSGLRPISDWQRADPEGYAAFMGWAYHGPAVPSWAIWDGSSASCDPRICYFGTAVTVTSTNPITGQSVTFRQFGVASPDDIARAFNSLPPEVVEQAIAHAIQEAIGNGIPVDIVLDHYRAGAGPLASGIIIAWTLQIGVTLDITLPNGFSLTGYAGFALDGEGTIGTYWGGGAGAGVGIGASSGVQLMGSNAPNIGALAGPGANFGIGGGWGPSVCADAFFGPSPSPGAPPVLGGGLTFGAGYGATSFAGPVVTAVSPIGRLW